MKAESHEKTEKSWPWASATFVALLSLLIASPAHAQETIGYVLEIKGDWVLDMNSPQQVFKGSALPAGGTIRIHSPYSESSYVKIADRHGKILIVRQCSNSKECDQPIFLPKIAAGESIVSRFFEAIMVIWKRDPDKYAVFRSRSSDEELKEAVLKLKDGRVDLSPAFRGLKSGQYLLRLKRVTTDDTLVTWDPKNSSLLSINDLGLGVYELQPLEKGTSEPLGAGSESWILVSAPDEYEKLRSSFQQAVTLANSWGEAVKSNTVRSFLRAYLYYLATQ